MQQHGSKYFPADPPPPPTLRGGVKRSKFKFLRHGHVVYRMKGNDTCSNIVPVAPPDFGAVKIQPFDDHIAYQIKWNHECSNIICIMFYILKGQDLTYSEHAYVASTMEGEVKIQPIMLFIKYMLQLVSTYFVLAQTFEPLGQNIFLK